ncbi:conserved hypothetical protein [Ricinus communis]|uniref:Uncharacterized protein n=1 Tax=Ricinus communis TaxID=3988 RepID=B9RWT2_RICCO|nr:conserved hypothetical protein [Ricinus communis]
MNTLAQKLRQWEWVQSNSDRRQFKGDDILLSSQATRRPHPAPTAAVRGNWLSLSGDPIFIRSFFLDPSANSFGSYTVRAVDVNPLLHTFFVQFDVI